MLHIAKDVFCLLNPVLVILTKAAWLQGRKNTLTWPCLSGLKPSFFTSIMQAIKQCAGW